MYAVYQTSCHVLGIHITHYTLVRELLYYFCDPPTKSSDEELGFFERESHYKLVHCVQCT